MEHMLAHQADVSSQAGRGLRVKPYTIRRHIRRRLEGFDTEVSEGQYCLAILTADLLEILEKRGSQRTTHTLEASRRSVLAYTRQGHLSHTSARSFPKNASGCKCYFLLRYQDSGATVSGVQRICPARELCYLATAGDFPQGGNITGILKR